MNKTIMEQKNSKRKLIIIVSIISILILTLGGSFALWNYFKIGANQQLIAGDIYMKYTGVNNLSIKNAMPSSVYDENNYFEFNIVGKNTHKDDIVYEIVLDHGDDSTDENRTMRIKDKLLKFRLVEVKDDLEEELIQEGSYDELVKRRIWVDRVKAGTKEIATHTYRLYMWVSIDTKIGNVEQDYTIEEWEKVFASVKVTVNGDFNEKELTEDYMILNAVNESGEKYDLKKLIESDEDITLTLGSKREVTKFVVSKSNEYPIALMHLEEPTDYEASYNDTTRSWEAKVPLYETGIYDYYAVYPEGKGQSKKYSFSVLFEPDRFVKVEKPTSALCKQGLTYTGSLQDLIAEENLDKEGYTIEQVQGTDANSYEVTAKLKENFRWSDFSRNEVTFNCSISKNATPLTYTPSSGFKVNKASENSIKITAPTSGTFEVTSSSSETASITFTPSSGTSTTVTVKGVEEGSTSLNVNFTPENENYTEKNDTYNITVTKMLMTTKLKNTLGQSNGVIGVTTSNTKKTTESSDIREYRYSGSSVNNYIYFNCTSSTQSSSNCETWRIIGVFKDENDEEEIKIVRNEVLNNVFPETYTVNEEIGEFVERNESVVNEQVAN